MRKTNKHPMSITRKKKGTRHAFTVQGKCMILKYHFMLSIMIVLGLLLSPLANINYDRAEQYK